MNALVIQMGWAVIECNAGLIWNASFRQVVTRPFLRDEHLFYSITVPRAAHLPTTRCLAAPLGTPHM
jgi:hypothetical protein